MSSLLPRPTLQLLSARSFSTSSPAFARSADSALAHKHRDIPLPPDPPSRWYKQSNFGLYGGKKPLFGNKVAEKAQSKTRRRWELNIHSRRLWSDSLGHFVRVRVLARVLRTIDKVGGLDAYLMGEKRARIKELGWGGWALRWKVMKTPVIRQKLDEERKRLGLMAENIDEVVERERELVFALDEKDVGGTMEIEDEVDGRGLPKEKLEI